MSKKIKRWMDLSISLLAVVLLAPFFLIVGIAVAIFLGRPIIFSQMRLGLNGKEFKIFKFRSMKDMRDQDGSPLPDDQKLTRFGRIVRSTSLDELTQLFNAINGDLSLVGPRPFMI